MDSVSVTAPGSWMKESAVFTTSLQQFLAILRATPVLRRRCGDGLVARGRQFLDSLEVISHGVYPLHVEEDFNKTSKAADIALLHVSFTAKANDECGRCIRVPCSTAGQIYRYFFPSARPPQ